MEDGALIVPDAEIRRSQGARFEPGLPPVLKRPKLGQADLRDPGMSDGVSDLVDRTLADVRNRLEAAWASLLLKLPEPPRGWHWEPEITPSAVDWRSSEAHITIRARLKEDR